MIDILIQKTTDWVALELDQSKIYTSFTLSLKDTDIENPTGIFTNYSKTFVVDATKTNKRIFDYIDNIQSLITGKKQYDCIIKHNGFLLDKGFIRIEEYSNKQFKCTFYSDLNLLFNKLKYNDDGTNRLLSDLYYGFYKYDNKTNNYVLLDKGTEQSGFYTWNADYIKKSWEVLTQEQKYKEAPNKALYKNITAAPLYTGYFDDFDNKSCIMYNAHHNAWLNSIFNLPQTSGSWSIFEYPRDMEQFECRDFRANQQHVAMKTELVLDAITNPDNNGGINIYWDESFNDKDSKYYKFYHDTWMIGSTMAESENTTLNGLPLISNPKNAGTIIDVIDSWSYNYMFNTVYSTSTNTDIIDLSNIVDPYITIRPTPDKIEPNTNKLENVFNNKLLFNGMTSAGNTRNNGLTWWQAYRIMGGFYATISVVDPNLQITDPNYTIYTDNYFITNGPVADNYNEYMSILRQAAQKCNDDFLSSASKTAALKVADLPKSKLITCEYIWDDSKHGYIRSGGRNIDIPASVFEGHDTVKVTVNLQLFTIVQLQKFINWMSVAADLSGSFIDSLIKPNLQSGQSVRIYTDNAVLINAAYPNGTTAEYGKRTLGRVTFCDNSDVDIYNQIIPSVDGADTSQDIYDKTNLFNTFKYSPLDILLSFTKLLGLKFVSDVDGVHIYTREHYYTKKTINIDESVDITNGININYNAYQNKQYIYNYSKNDNYVEYLYNKKMKHDPNLVSITTDAVGKETTSVFDKLLYTNCLLYKLNSPYFNSQSLNNNPLLSGVHVVYNKRDNGNEQKQYHVHPRGYYLKEEDNYGNICLFDKDVKDISPNGLLLAFIDGTEFYSGSGTPWIISDNLRVMQQLVGENCHLMIPGKTDQTVNAEIGEGASVEYTIKTVNAIPHFSPYNTTSQGLYNTLLNNLDVNITGVGGVIDETENVFELFHKQESNELYNTEQKILTLNVLLKNVDNINNLPRNFYVFQGNYWRIKEINELKLDHDSTIAKITFMKVIDINNY